MSASGLRAFSFSLAPLVLAGCARNDPAEVIYRDDRAVVLVRAQPGQGVWLKERPGCFSVSVRQQDHETTLFCGPSGPGGMANIVAARLKNGRLALKDQWILAAEVEPATWVKSTINRDSPADPRLRDALLWMATEPRGGVEPRADAALILVRLGVPEARVLLETLAREPLLPDAKRNEAFALLGERNDVSP